MSNSRIFDYISRRGNAIADRRALERHPDYADREARREAGGTGGNKLMADGKEGSDLTVDSFFEDMKLTDRYRPWWLKVSLHIRWWMGDHGPRATISNIKAYRQRGKRGWADRDTWGFDTFLANVMRDGITYLNKTKHGWPDGRHGVATFEDWTEVLDEIVEGMQAHLDILEHLPQGDEYDALVAKRDQAMEHLKNHFGSLWD